MIICLLAIVANAQSVENTPMVKVYCTITCSEYNLLKNDVNVKVDSNSIFGGVDAKRHENRYENTRTIYINSTCMFGGVDIK